MGGWSPPNRDVMMIPATMIRIAAPRIAIAISPAEYLVFFCTGPDGWVVRVFFFLRGFFDITEALYRGVRNSRQFQCVPSVDDYQYPDPGKTASSEISEFQATRGCLGVPWTPKTTTKR